MKYRPIILLTAILISLAVARDSAHFAIIEQHGNRVIARLTFELPC